MARLKPSILTCITTAIVNAANATVVTVQDVLSANKKQIKVE